MADPVYIIGIDLGTTNTIVAYTEAALKPGAPPRISVFSVPQLTSMGAVEKREMLPSFIYLPNAHERSGTALSLPWERDPQMAVGEYARNRGEESPQRMISSAKSWLCNAMVDRKKAILPWGSGTEDLEKLSPVEASSRVLSHVREAWNHEFAKENHSLAIEHQEIYLTVPASFDAVARELTVQAAAMAGLPNVILLEEPQAVFYAWIDQNGEKWRDQVTAGDRVLVCDVGGGTTDFSLIQVSDEGGNLVLDRVAVGNHLLVGGDNMDLALAYAISVKMSEKGQKLDAWQMRGLGHSCRQAKEKLLAGSGTESVPVTILGRGKSLIGGTIRTELYQEEASRVIVEGFFPECEATDRPKASKTLGLKEIGLSYEADPAVTRHLAHFIENQKREGSASGLPTAVLFNGGIMKAPSIRKRLMSVLAAWQAASGGYGRRAIRELTTADFDLSVARGAAYYGLARRGQGIRIRGGLGRSYYIGVAASMPAIPGMPAPVKALCVAPFGTEEGETVSLPGKEFVLVVGEPVKFDFMGSSQRFDDTAGTVVEEWEGEIEEITTVETTLEGEYGAFIPVTIEVRVTEIGTLEFYCVSREDHRKWKLEFNVREKP